MNEEQAQLSNRSFQIFEAPTPEGVFTLNISLSEETDYDVEDFDKNGDGIADGDYYYADGAVRLIKLTAQLEKDSTDTYFSVVNQPIAITVQGGSGDLVQEDGDDFVSGTTDGNGIVEFYFDDRYDDSLYTFNASY